MRAKERVVGSEFWRYFKDVLRWPLIHRPGALAALVRGKAGFLDTSRDDIVYFRKQWFPEFCEDGLVPSFGNSRGLVRHPKENAEQFRQRVVHAFAWHLLGGKVEGLPQILKFYGFDIGEIVNMRDYSPERWAEFQIGLKTPASQKEQQAILDDLDMLIWLLNEYKPARSLLFRIYTDTYNMKPGVWSRGHWSQCLWSFWSGVPYPDPGSPGGNGSVVVSFGLVCRAQSENWLPTDFLAAIWQEEGRLFVIPRRRLEWSGCDWSDIFTRRHGFFGAAILVGHVGERAVISEIWPDEPWSDKPWGTGEIWDRRLPSWRMFDFGQAKSQGVWSDKSDKSNSTWSGLNCCWSVPYHDMIVGETPKWSGAKWGEKRQRVMRVKIYERFRHFTRLSPAPVNPVFDGSSRAFGESFMALGAAKAKTPVWSADKWSGGIALRGNFFFESVLATLAGGPVEGSEPWPDEAWPEKPWGEVSRYGREYPEWKMWACGDVRAAQTARILDAPKPAICAASLLATIAGETVESSGDWESGEWQDAPWGGIGLVDLERADPAASVSSVSAALVENRIEESGPWPDDIGWQDAEWEAQTLSGLGHHAFGAAISGDNR